MPISQKQYPVRFTAKGLVDALDSTDKFPGACVGLANLIFDQGNPEIVVSRPGVTNLTNMDEINYMSLSGAAGTYASTPHTAALNFAGDATFTFYGALTDWTPAAQNVLINKWDAGGGQRSFVVGVQTNGCIFIKTRRLGLDITQTSSTALVISDTVGAWGQVRYQKDNGTGRTVATFYYSFDSPGIAAADVAWIQLGTPQTLSVFLSGAIPNSTAELEIGASDGGTLLMTAGKVFRAQTYSGIGSASVIASDFNASDAAVGAPTVTSSTTGEIYTLQGAAAIVNASVGFQNPGFVSVHVTIGDYVYGMVATSRNVGKDEPFAFNHATGLFTTITGVLAGNCPVSPSTAGAWTPPTMSVIGTKLIVTHPGFPGGATKFGVLDISNLAAPTWTATDTAVNALPSVPIAVANYRNRAYFWCGNTLPWTDVLDPLTRTLAAQSLTIGDSTAGTAFQGLPVQTTSGGIIAALIAFKGFQIWQITGDTTTGDLAQNFISLTIGTQAPRSVCLSPKGVYFASTSGPKVIDQFGVLRSLTHSAQEIEPDIQVPWQNMQTPSRVSAGYSGDLYRICMDTVIEGVNVTNDYWFDEHRNRWNGPHTFPYDCASQHEDHFIITGAGNPGILIHSRSASNASSVYQDLGVAFSTTLQSSTFPKTGHMTMKQVVESTMELAASGGAASYAITGLDDQGNTLNSCNVSILSAGSLWGQGVWGSFVWSATNNKPSVYTVPWTAPLVFKKMALYITATASASVSFGTFFARYQDLGYSNNRPTPP